MSCRLSESELDAYFDSELSADSSRVIGEHLEKCAYCRGRLAERAALASLIRAVPRHPTPDHLRTRVLAQANTWRSVLRSRADFVVGTRTMDRRPLLIEFRTASEYFRWSEDSTD